MGVYINPKKETKEEWLAKNGRLICEIWPEKLVPNFESFLEKKELPIILVDNGMFTAAGVGFDEREYKMMIECENDTRPKTLFSASIKKIRKVSDLDKYLKHQKLLKRGGGRNV